MSPWARGGSLVRRSPSAIVWLFVGLVVPGCGTVTRTLRRDDAPTHAAARAVREVSRFVVNSTFGFGGLFDAAKTGDLKPSREDFGQTLGFWGAGPGPYLVMPFFGPMTVRDGIGRGVDGAMNPLNYFIPFFFDQLGMKIRETINDRALNYELFQGVEEPTT